VTDSALLPRQWVFNPQDWRVRVKWVGFGSIDSTLHSVPASSAAVERIVIPSPRRVLGTFEMPNARLRVIWLGLDSMNDWRIWMLGLFIVLLSIFAFRQITNRNDVNLALHAEEALPADLITDEVSLGDETIRMSHSPLDIGQSKDVFDDNLETLMRGREANPFILDFQFSQPQTIKGLVMDFGRMDFDVRIQVYSKESTDPFIYRGEYRQQPSIPHIDIDFADGPDQVSRIYIEIEQFDPPEEVHIHIREVLFKR
jgi:hypothetical protein